MSKSITLIWQLLRKHISIFELTIFFITNLIGMVVILAGVQIYSDLKPILSGDEAIIGNDYVVVTHPVTRVGINTTSFSTDDIEELQNQEFVNSVGRFTSSQFEVNGSILFGGRRLSTMLFFESIPDEFIDATPDSWGFAEGDTIIPIILPRNYLNLYNFGFSSTQKLPQITEAMVKSVSLGIELSGNGHTDEFTGRVAGFSDRINTILVPEAFMSWANRHYANVTTESPTRLILEVANPSDPNLLEFLEENNYVLESKPAESGKALFILKVCIAIIVVIGVIFSLLSIIILTLSIHLLLQKNITKLETLTLIGYTPNRVAMPYNALTIALNGSILILSLVAVFVAQNIYSNYLSQLDGITISSSPAASIVVGIALTVLITALNIFIINRKIKEISRKR